MSNTYTYDVPKTMPDGLYWYHSHRHTMTAQQTYAGLSGLLEIGHPDGNLPLVTRKQYSRAGHGDSVQLRLRSQGKGASAQQLHVAAVRQHAEGAAREPTRRRFVPTGAGAGELRRNHEGAHYATPWYSGPLSPQQQSGPDPVHAAESDRLLQPDRECRRRPGAIGEPARRAIHGQRPVSAGTQDQTGADRDLGDRQHQRHRLHDTAIDRDGYRESPEVLHRRPGREPLHPSWSAGLRRRHDARHSAWFEVRDRRHDAQGRRPRPRVPARPEGQGDKWSRRAVHEQRHEESTRGAGRRSPSTRSTSAMPTDSSCSRPRR